MKHPVSEPDAMAPSRPFSQATGLVFQTAGFVLTLGTCCWWSFAGRFDQVLRPEDPTVLRTEWLSLADAEAIWGMLAVCICFVGGLALTAAGIALQHGLAHTGRAACWLTGMVAGFFGCYAAAAAIWFPGVGRLITIAVVGAVWAALFLLAGASNEELRQAPPAARDSSWSRSDEDALRTTLSPHEPDKTNR